MKDALEDHAESMSSIREAQVATTRGLKMCTVLNSASNSAKVTNIAVTSCTMEAEVKIHPDIC